MNSSIDLQHHDGIPVARLVGEVDLTRAPGIRVGLLRAVTNQDHGLVLDLRDTTYLDSAGVNIIFELAERLSARQQRLAAVVPDRAIIERVLELVNMRSILESHRTLEAAIGAIRALGPGEPAPGA
ncbi:MAG TPA: STAS domain-containing protein [Thermoleophilaceae bacterium]|nr:STAS domain-containing protein [Thermoleophilaceae bacterium]